MNCVLQDENIKRASTNSYYYYGYLITRNGEIISPSGNLIHSYNFTYPNSHVTLRINSKSVKKNKAILIYELFSGERLQRNKYIIQFRDGNSDNAAFDNLYLVSRPEYWSLIKKEIPWEDVVSRKSKKKKYGKYINQEKNPFVSYVLHMMRVLQRFKM